MELNGNETIPNAEMDTACGVHLKLCFMGQWIEWNETFILHELMKPWSMITMDYVSLNNQLAG